jgi:GNAT superfamily N-acetyltransferase
MPHVEHRRDNFTISTDKSRLQLDVIHGFLTNSYWAKHIPMKIVRKAVRNALCFGVYDGERQIGLARVITDRATFAYLADVFILEPYRGKGLSKWLMQCVMAHPDLQGLRNWLLFTRDAHGLYSQYGFETVTSPERIMVIRNADVYLQYAEETSP